ncbi:MAG: riboflavin kinase, partial [Prevotella sp.]|nr:riboflavin kinase [Prevotella sp.]
MNIGSRPTFNGSRITIEVNIFNCKERLYGETVTVAVCHRLRDERKFADIAALKEQLKADAEVAKAKLQSNSL